MFGKESLGIAKMLKQSGNRLETGVGMKMEEILSFQAVFFHYSFTIISTHHGLGFLPYCKTKYSY